MKKNIFLFIVILVSISFYACEKQIDNAKVTYRVIDFQDGFNVYYKSQSDTLLNLRVDGPYTLATPWMFTFMSEPGEIVYVSVRDTVENSFSRVQILIDGKIYKEKSRTNDRFMPVTVSGIIPFN